MEKNLSIHRTSITSARRRNNIYGEISDFITMAILELGADAVFYNPVDDNVATIYAKSENKLYLINVQYQENSKTPVNISDEIKKSLTDMAAAIDATPLYAICRNYSRVLKLYDLSGHKLACLM